MSAVPPTQANPGLYGEATHTLNSDSTSTRPTSPHEEKKSRDDDSLDTASDTVRIEDVSRGVREMEILVERMTVTRKVIIFAGLILLSYVMSMNQSTSTVYFNAAVSNQFGKHSLQSTISTVQSVFQAMAQPPIAKCADAFGRVRTYFGCVFFYALGYIVVASSNGVVTYAVGNSIYIIGITGLFFLQNIIVADISSTRYRWWWTQFPNILQVINYFVAGQIASSLIGSGQERVYLWRWGFGMFTILVPVIAAPIIATIWWGSRPDVHQRARLQAAKERRLRSRPRAVERAETIDMLCARREGATPLQQRWIDMQLSYHSFDLAGSSHRSWVSLKSIFWQLDFIGLVLFVIGFGLFFVTITTANSRTARWSDAHSIAQLVVGAVAIVAFIVWERVWAPHPLLPFALLRRKTVIGCVLIALFSPMSGRIIGQYLYTFLIVAAGKSTKTATNITTWPSAAGVFVGIGASLLAARLRTLKWFLVAGFSLQMLGTGLMIRYRTSTNSNAELYIVQIIRGMASAFIPYPCQSLIQSATPHEQLAAITAGWLVVYYIAGGIGSAIGGAIWTNVLPGEISKRFAPFQNETLEALAYNNPLGMATQYPMGSPERLAIGAAQDHAQRIMVISGLCVVAAALLTSIFLLDDLKLTDEQSLSEEDQKGEKNGQKAFTFYGARKKNLHTQVNNEVIA